MGTVSKIISLAGVFAGIVFALFGRYDLATYVVAMSTWLSVVNAER